MSTVYPEAPRIPGPLRYKTRATKTAWLKENPTQCGARGGEIAMLRAAVSDEIKDATCTPDHPPYGERWGSDNALRVIERARRWLTEAPQPMRDICDLADIDWRAVQSIGLKLKANGWVLPPWMKYADRQS